MKDLGNLYVLTFLFLFGIASCGRDTVNLSEIISINLPDTVIGDGSTAFEVTAFLNSSSDKSLRMVKFTATKGQFKEASDENKQEAIVSAELLNDSIRAVVQWIVPADTGIGFITAEPVLEDKGGVFLVTDSISIIASLPKSLSLKANSFSVYNQYDGEISVTGLVRNAQNKSVNSGTLVEIKDVFSATGQDVNGRYRDQHLSTNNNSEISTIYSPGSITADQYILLIGTVLNPDGSPSNIKDSIEIYVNEK